jgi:hypothetical protein
VGSIYGYAEACKKPGLREWDELIMWFYKTRSYYRKENAASPQGIKGSMHNLLNRGCLYDPALPGDTRQDDFDVLK